ncbi:MAG: DEAD/DEAH box helicase family protein [Holophagales bacterium]|jgi:predicted helicase|nr:DEAD/DEAH box helicase family protein [Holophagales bacterium]
MHTLTLDTILEKYDKEAATKADKGLRFERLMRAFLESAPVYSEVEKAWLWKECPMRQELGPDTGIDIVCRTKTGEYWGVQCKFYDEDGRVSMPDIDKFLGRLGSAFHIDGKKKSFSFGLWIDTTAQIWNDNVLSKFSRHEPEAKRINLGNLRAYAGVDWGKLDAGNTGTAARVAKHEPKEHQKVAIGKAMAHFQKHDRGRLIMACGTGKTFTALRIAEDEVLSKDGTVLVLVPSIALVGQLMWEWKNQTRYDFFPICVCSDPSATSKKKKDDGVDTIEDDEIDMPLPATSSPSTIAILHKKHPGPKVIFSTYQSLDKVAKAQAEHSLPKLGMVICDEAHRTIGYKLPNEKASSFHQVHDADYIKAKKRLYMTATPRMYRPGDIDRLKEKDAIVWSMDDVNAFGPEIHELKFGTAVAQGLLTDYKVLTLTVSEDDVPESTKEIFTRYKANYRGTAKIEDDWDAKIIGCVNALSKQLLGDGSEKVMEQDPGQMKRAVAFSGRIADSVEYTELFKQLTDDYIGQMPEERRGALVGVEIEHIDGGMGASSRQQMVERLRKGPEEGNCRILSNVRCLAEGVDVPSLDAVLYLAPKKSIVDVVQSVGRVMRLSKGKKFGYIIIPIFVSKGEDPEAALDDSEKHKVLWQVLQALRSHDDRFDDTINKIDLNIIRPNNIVVAKPAGPKAIKRHSKFGVGTTDGGSGGDGGTQGGGEQPKLIDLAYEKFETFQRIIFARIVKNVGTRRPWEDWAKDVADIARNQAKRIKKAVEGGDERAKDSYGIFLKEMQETVDATITSDGAIEMLAQHLITAPVFESLFENYQFVKFNAVSNAMEVMLEILRQSKDMDQRELDKMKPFYDSVRARAKDIDNPAGRQKVVIELYNNFFRAAFPKLSEMLGIVYTPVEIVDFIIKSVDDVLKAEMGLSLASPGVNVLDPYTGTGTFITRLIESGLVPIKDLERKYLGGKYSANTNVTQAYTGELYANELVLLAYYIACVNIENAFHYATNYVSYEPFRGIALTDTFGAWDATLKGHPTSAKKVLFDDNAARVSHQQDTPITVIIGNPPYSAGQRSANDNAQNYKYDELDRAIARTYVAESTATNNNALYDSYIRAFRHATDRLGDRNGIICFVSNGGWLDGNSTAGFRKTIEKEFSKIYVFNLRGNQRTSGELSRREGGKIFGSGSRTPVAITLLVKRAGYKGKAEIYYRDIGDKLDREAKLKIIKNFKSFLNLDMKLIRLHPNEHGDWITTRNEAFQTFIPLASEKKFDKDTKSAFLVHSRGLETARDAWVYNFSRATTLKNISGMVDFYNSQLVSNCKSYQSYLTTVCP